MKEEIGIMIQSKPFLPGTLAEHYNVCGKAQCRCKDKINPRKHGPYYRLSYSLSGKNSSIAVSREDAPFILEMTENYRKFRTNTQILGLEIVESYRKDGLRGMLDKYERITNNEVSKKIGSKPPSRILLETAAGRQKWKTKAVERKSEIEKLQVTIRDLINSRDNWKTKAMHQKKVNQELNRELVEVKKNFSGSKGTVNRQSSK